MTKKEVANNIISKAAEYGFTLFENGVGWFADRTDLGGATGSVNSYV